MPQPSFDVSAGHRWFAIEFNNQAWDLVESNEVGGEDLERMLHLAHAAWMHWQIVGDSLNHQRAACLLSVAYAKVDRSAQAQQYAGDCLRLSEENGDRQSPFDRASAFGCAARAAAIAGDHALASRYYDEVLRSVTAFDDPSERELIGQLFPIPQ